MERQRSKYARVFAGLLLGAILTSVFGFLLAFLAMHMTPDHPGGGDGTINLRRGVGSFILGIYGAILGIFEGAILGGIVAFVNSGSGKSFLIGGVINVLIVVFIGALLGMEIGRHDETAVIIFVSLLILGQFLAGGIAGLLVSAILRSADKDQQESYD